MTVAEQNPVTQHVANGATTSFAYQFLIYDADELEVWLDDAQATSGFSVTGEGEETGGTVDFAVAPAADVVVTILRGVPLERTTDYQNAGDFRSSTVNEDFNRLWMAIQQINRDMAYVSPLVAPEVSREIPFRAGKYLKWNDAGTSLTTADAIYDEGGAAVLADLAEPDGAGLVGYGSRTVLERLGDIYSVKDAGVIDGSDDAAVIQAALLASDSVFLPDGTYTLNEAVYVQQNQVIRGDFGRVLINIVGDHPGFIVDGRPSEGYAQDARAKISGLIITGSGKGASFNAGASAQYGIYMTYAYNCQIDNCFGYALGGALIATANTRIEPSGTVYVEGNTVTNCRSYDCNAGFMSLVRGEYTNVSGCAFVSGHVGAWVRGGNNTISACNLSLNGTGVHLADGDNDAHGVVQGCQINHSVNYGIYVEDNVVLGHRFIGCEIYSAAIYLGACKFITIESSDISTSTWTFNGATKCWIRNNTFFTARASITYNHTNSEVFFENNKNAADEDAGAVADKYQGGFLRASRITSSQTVAAASNAVLVWNSASINAVSNNATYTLNTFLDTATGHITAKSLHGGPTTIIGTAKAEITTDYTSVLLSLEINGTHKMYMPAVDQLAVGPSTYRRIFCLNATLLLNKNDVIRFRLINGSASNAANFLVSESLLEINGL